MKNKILFHAKRNYLIRFIVIFAILAALVGIGKLLGGTPSAWTIAIMLTASFVLAYMTKPEDV